MLLYYQNCYILLQIKMIHMMCNAHVSYDLNLDIRCLSRWLKCSQNLVY